MRGSFRNALSNESIKSVMKNRLRQALFGLFVLSLGAYAYGAFTSTLFDQGLADKRAFLVTASRAPEGDPAEIRRQAEAYWDLNPDVAHHEYFGRDGKFGLYGARTHYLRHGRYEGRMWPQ